METGLLQDAENVVGESSGEDVRWWTGRFVRNYQMGEDN